MHTTRLQHTVSTAVNKPLQKERITSIDLLRAVVMIIMALDHVRAYFHRDAFLYSPTDLGKTNLLLFFTRFITHYCAPVFVLLAGIAAYLHGRKRSKAQLSFYLLTRGGWLLLAELFIVTLGWSFNLAYPFFNLQVIWAIGISMIFLSVLVYMPRTYLFIISLLLIAMHNLLDTVHVPGHSFMAVVWSLLHEPADFVLGRFSVFIHYPVLPWIGIIALGYCMGYLYDAPIPARQRKKILLITGTAAIMLFILLRAFNIYGDASRWTLQKNNSFTILSFLNLTKYPPSFLYILATLGPAMICLAAIEKPLNAITGKIIVFGRVPFFFYILHLYAIHLLAWVAAQITGYSGSAMILTERVNRVQALKGYGFSLATVYLVWIGLIVLLYPLCKWFSNYKKANQVRQPWLTYF
ncbi:MAG TPA: heparan-alpha-glucosaminide N-acetyltransferase domain-containing protein [Chitinophagaceae bacterium]|nr:heparan-alpha-glucosaminide N-acetyltransferase domain-containing protein [Chitinophagaceae bacterium]